LAALGWGSPALPAPMREPALRAFRSPADTLSCRGIRLGIGRLGSPQEAMGSTRSRVVMFHIGRSGSTVLADMLGQTPTIHWDGEIYAFQYQAHEKLRGPFRVGAVEPHFDHLELLRRRVGLFPGSIYGFEVKFFHLLHGRLPLERFLNFLNELGFDKFIILKRKNYLRKIISSLVARQTGAYHLPVGASAPRRRIVLNVRHLEMDRQSNSLVGFLQDYKDNFDKLDFLLSRHDVLNLTYEDDIEFDPLAAYRKTVDFLGVSRGIPIARFGKTTPYPIREIIMNYDEVRGHLSSTEFLWMLDG
jgi:hypothetical protein